MAFAVPTADHRSTMPPATLGGPALRVRDWLRRTLDAKLEQALGGPARKRVVLLLAGVLSLTSADMATVGAAPTRPAPPLEDQR